MQHRAAIWSFVIAFMVGFGASIAACAVAAPADDGTGSGLPPDAGSPNPATCPLCVTDKDCNGGVCAQIGSDSYCAPACPNGNECAADRVCTTVSTVEGAQTSVCVPQGSGCGATVGPGANPSGNGGGSPGGGSTDSGCSAVPSETCGSLNGPSIASPCTCTSGKQCAANGCYGGWWCNSATKKCQSPPPPSTCAASTGGSCESDAGSIAIDAGGPVTGNIGPNGGTTSRLLFAVVGDTRPATINDTAGYPTPVITKIWDDIEALSPRPPFAVTTGDYVFSTATGTQAAPQMDLYLQARAHFAGTAFPAMGNHECTGATTSNCGAGNADGMTANYQTFLSKMLAPLGKTSPNYVIDINASDGSWTAKFVFVAGNAWSASDATWLDGVLAQPTTYTFIVRHEPKAASAPGEQGSEQVMAQHPYTLAIVGHTHTYAKTGPKQVTIGNGGAPLVGGANYGFGLIQQRADGAIQVDMIDSTTGQPDLGFRFALKADGSPAP